MISKNQIKYIKGLEQRKIRKREGIFVAEGPKVVGDLLRAGMVPVHVYATEEWYRQQGISPRTEDGIISNEELHRISFLQHPQQVLALFPIPSYDGEALEAGHELVIALDSIQDPGNLGTIIRIADWFGISTIVCSHETADAYNPKVVQATMGSIARVRMVYTDLGAFLDQLPEGTPVYGTFLDGNNLYQETLSSHGIIVMGNEGNGISEAIASRINRRLLIPPFPEGRETAESLNVAVATAITCAEFRRANRLPTL